jgi:hypothetical protein
MRNLAFAHFCQLTRILEACHARRGIAAGIGRFEASMAFLFFRPFAGSRNLEQDEKKLSVFCRAAE